MDSDSQLGSIESNNNMHLPTLSLHCQCQQLRLDGGRGRGGGEGGGGEGGEGLEEEFATISPSSTEILIEI